MKLSWKLINEVINKRITKTELPNAFKEHDIEVTDHKEIAERFNIYIYIYFVNIGPRLAEKIPENIINFASYLEKSNVNSIALDQVTERGREIV